MRKHVTIFIWLAILAIGFALPYVSGCGGAGGGPNGGGGGGESELSMYFDSSLPSGVISLEVAQIASTEYSRIVALGNLNPSDHTLPTDHIYFVHEDTSETIPIYAPVGGKILDIHTFNYADGHDNRIVVGVKSRYSYYLIHLVADAGLSVGETVTTGQQLGVASKHAAAVDLGVLAQDYPQSFIEPTHYGTMNIYSQAPLQYYVEPVKSELYSRVYRLGSDKDGIFCYDQAGKLVGGWFKSGVTSTDISSGSSYGTKEIAFVYDNYNPDQINISIGGTVFTKGVYFVQPGASDPANVTSASGKITYLLYNASAEAPGSARVGMLIAQMTDANTVKLEASANTVESTMSFSGAEYTYTR